jgi:hypothetical protein
MPHSYFSSHSHSSRNLPSVVNRLAKCMSDIDFSTLSKGLHHTPQRLLNSISLHKGDFVFVRIDRVRRPLEAPYEGPYEVLDFDNKIVKLKLNSDKTVVVSIDRIKLAHLRKPVATRHPILCNSPASDSVPADPPPKNENRRVSFAID